MDITPIKTKADYTVALAEIEGLMNAEPDTPEGNRLDVLPHLLRRRRRSITGSTRYKHPNGASGLQWASVNRMTMQYFSRALNSAQRSCASVRSSKVPAKTRKKVPRASNSTIWMTKSLPARRSGNSL